MTFDEKLILADLLGVTNDPEELYGWIDIHHGEELAELWHRTIARDRQGEVLTNLASFYPWSDEKLEAERVLFVELYLEHHRSGKS